MTSGDYVIFASGFFLGTFVLWRGSRALLWKEFPFFYAYLSYVLIHNTVSLIVGQISPSAYALTYWVGAAVAAFLRFFIIWEVFRHTFFSTPAARRLVGQILTTLLVALTIVLFLVSKRPGLFFADLERKSGFVQAALLMAIFLLARYYVIPLGRNIWGMALGLGLYVSVSVINFASLELIKSFVPYWRLILPLSFIGMMGVWTWALWSYVPNPQPATATFEGFERGLAHWAESWSEVRAALRKAVGL